MTKRTIALLVLALGGCAPPSRMSQPLECNYGTTADGYCKEDPDVPIEIQPPVRTHTVETEKPADGFDISAVPAGATGWRVSVTNNTGSVASVVLDESTFVTSGGESAGRLISGDTRKIDTAKAQPPLPVAPGATIKQFVLSEKFIRDEEAEVEVIGRNVRTSQMPKVEKIRAARYALIVGGKLYVTVQGASGKQTWTGVVVAPAAGGE